MFFLSVHIARFMLCVLYFAYFVYFIDIPPCNSVRLSHSIKCYLLTFLIWSHWTRSTWHSSISSSTCDLATACHQRVFWYSLVFSPLAEHTDPFAAGDFDRLMLLPATFHEHAQLWAIDPSLLLGCSTSVEQSTTSSQWLWTIAFRVSPVTENTFAWLKIAAPSDLLLDVVRFTNVLTYLLSNLRPHV